MSSCVDIDKLTASTQKQAVAKIFSPSTFIPFLGDMLANIDALKCGMTYACGDDSLDGVNNAIKENQGKLKDLTQNWQNKLTDVVREQSYDMKDLLDTLPLYINERIDVKIEPLSEKLTILTVQVLVLGFVLFFVITHYR
jgi:hypothetical protein